MSYGYHESLMLMVIIAQNSYEKAWKKVQQNEKIMIMLNGKKENFRKEYWRMEDYAYEIVDRFKNYMD